MSETRLLKCPFCGRMPELRHEEGGFSFIVCTNDGCYTKTDGHLNDESAIKAWNTRKPLERILERLDADKEQAHPVERQAIEEVIEIIREEGHM